MNGEVNVIAAFSDGYLGGMGDITGAAFELNFNLEKEVFQVEVFLEKNHCLISELKLDLQDFLERKQIFVQNT